MDTRETLRNKGFRTDFAPFFLFDPSCCFKKPRFCGPCSTIIFSACHYFLLSEVCDFLTKLGFEVQKRVGAAEPRSFSDSFFFVVSGARANLTRGGRAGASAFLSGLVSLAKMALLLRCGGFSRLFRSFCSSPFSQTSSGPLHTPFFLLRCFFLFAFFLGLGATPHCTCVIGQLAFNPFFGGFLGSFYKNIVFPPDKGLFWFISQCLPFLSPFRSPWFLSLLFVTLSMFLFSCFFSFLVVFSLFLPSLFFLLFFIVLFLRFCFMIRPSKYYIRSFFFTNDFCLFFCFLFQICSYI